jgi:hypothetical protein
MPPASIRVGRKAIKNGFKVRATYARGPRMDSHWRVVEISDSVAVRGEHEDGRWFVVAWVTKTGIRGAKAGVTAWEFDLAYTLDPTSRLSQACTVKPLEAYLVTTHSEGE